MEVRDKKNLVNIIMSGISVLLNKIVGSFPDNDCILLYLYVVHEYSYLLISKRFIYNDFIHRQKEAL